MTAIFAAGAAGRIATLDLPRYSQGTQLTTSSRWHPTEFHRFLEQDEKIYLALVEQLNAGKGYTLQGHPLLKELVGEQYGYELFFHPPGAVALFWVSQHLFGERGFALAQVFSYVVFFWSLFWLGSILIRPLDDVAAITLAILGSITPIMAFVAGRFWLDAPIIAFSTLAAAMFLSGVVRGRLWLVGAGGAVLGYAILIKLTSVLIVPALIMLAWALRPRETWRQYAIWAALLVGVAFLVQVPWELWQWHIVGSPFPSWAGKPATRLVMSNNFVKFQTIIRGPWAYVQLLPQVIWTLIPSLVMWAAARRVRDVGRVGGGLVCWIAAVVGAHMILGAMGYSKIVRYIVLVTPATCILFALTFSATIQSIPLRKLTARAMLLLTLALGGLGLEVAQGLKTSLYDNARGDMLTPLPGMPGVDYWETW
ncbi:MAG TPA: glycosyltransferase family 39 protein [Vicinamibacterales bacterium]|nr:glycosyltransferase family 39 protein [Vicinamibacterales bacterium]